MPSGWGGRRCAPPHGRKGSAPPPVRNPSPSLVLPAPLPAGAQDTYPRDSSQLGPSQGGGQAGHGALVVAGALGSSGWQGGRGRGGGPCGWRRDRGWRWGWRPATREGGAGCSGGVPRWEGGS